MDVLARMEGFWVCILFLLLYFFVVCEHLGRLFQSSFMMRKFSNFRYHVRSDFYFFYFYISYTCMHLFYIHIYAFIFSC